MAAMILEMHWLEEELINYSAQSHFQYILAPKGPKGILDVKSRLEAHRFVCV